MNKEKSSLTLPPPEESQTKNDKEDLHSSRELRRRSFLKGLGVSGAALSASAFLGAISSGKARAEDEGSGSLTKGDAAILRFLAAAEIIESDLWLQYQELGGIQDDEVSKLASQLIPGYPAKATGGNVLYTKAVSQLDTDMAQ